MPLIFAVDSDKRQSAQLASLLRSHVDADLVQSATVLDGIDVLQGRIPDLILTSSLLSPRDESALANHMRELGARAAHVHTLTIPVLAAARKPSKKRPTGVLGALRREKGADVEAAGCEPEVFAKEVKIYLGRAVDERGGTDAASVEPVYAAPEYTEPEYAEPQYVEPQYTEPQYTEPQYAESVDLDPVAVVEPEAPDSDAVAPTAVEKVADQGPGALYLDQPEIIERDALMAKPPAAVADAFAPPDVRVPVVDMSSFDDLDALAAQLAAPSGAMPAVSVPAPAVDPFEQFFVPQSAGVAEIVGATADETLSATIELLSFDEVPDNGLDGADEPAVEVEPAVSSDTWFERMTAIVHSEAPAKPEAPQAPEPVFSWIDNQNVSSLSDVLSRVRASDSDAHEPAPPRRAAPVAEEAPAPIVEQTPAAVVPMAAVEAETPMEITVIARPEVVVDLVLPPAAPFLDPDVLAMFGAAAHRAGLDALESLSRPRPVEGDRAIPMSPIPGPERPPRAARESKAERRSRRKAPRPAQDEWGMYDPNQCGPAALFDEDSWNEIDTDEKTPVRRPRAS